MYAVTVTFTLAPGTSEAFMPLMLENARASVRDEPGCQQFDVCHNASAPETVFLFELYDDLAAFDAHRGMPHYAAFNDAAGGYINDKQVACFEVVQR